MIYDLFKYQSWMLDGKKRHIFYMYTAIEIVNLLSTNFRYNFYICTDHEFLPTDLIRYISRQTQWKERAHTIKNELINKSRFYLSVCILLSTQFVNSDG